MRNIAHMTKTTGFRIWCAFRNIPIAFRRAGIKLSIYVERGFLKDAEQDVESFTTESIARHKRQGRQDYNNVVTMEIDSRMIRAMDELKKLRKSQDEKEEKLSKLSYKVTK